MQLKQNSLLWPWKIGLSGGWIWWNVDIAWFTIEVSHGLIYREVGYGSLNYFLSITSPTNLSTRKATMQKN